ncbi:HPr family phosphocarrier protein [Pseudarthrobacter sp. NPDC058196]|uniref:HPr family phosphocarrier protein n=1 Tax=Pseudarthrobacter sp. NPDC058196 TaxID=3346376 RepID=UPI0036DF4A72
MPILKAVVTAPEGLHARSAAVFVRAVTDTGLPLTIRKADGVLVDARSLLQVMAADFQQGCDVELAVSDDALDGAQDHRRAREALRGLGRLLESQGATQSV